MSSQGSKSVRVFSRVTFMPVLGDPLSREVSELSISSTESVPEVWYRYTVKGAMEPTPEVASRPEHRGAYGACVGGCVHIGSPR